LPLFFDIGANRAIDLIIAKESGTGGSRFGRAAAAPGRVVGAHPSGGDISAKDGRYGPYVSWNGINATLPKGMAPDAVTIEEAVALLAARAAAAPSKKTAVKKSVPAKKPAAKKPAAKKAVAKKPAAKKAPSSKD
jgi:DNA topoisomerase-1